MTEREGRAAKGRARRGQGGRPQAAPPARQRFGSSRLLAAALFAAGAALALQVHFEVHPPAEFERTTSYFIGAAVSGLVAAWRLLGLRLGRGYGAAVAMALTSAAAAAVIFCLLGGLKAVIDTYAYGAFSTVMELIEYLLARGITTGQALLVSPGLVAGAVMAVLIGLLCEALHRVWDVMDPPEP